MSLLRLMCSVLFFSFLNNASDASVAKNETSVLVSSKQNPKAFIENIGNKALDIINTKNITADQVAEEFKNLLQNNFAMEKISKFALGKYNVELEKNGIKSIFDKFFINMLIKVYSSRFREYKTSKFTVLSVKKKSDIQHLVYSKISIPEKESIDVVWSVYNINNELRVFDVRISGVSMSKIQQTDICGRIGEVGITTFIKEFQVKYDK